MAGEEEGPVLEPARAPKREGRSPAFVYSGLSAALVLVIAALTITASQTPPPAIAELAPAAIEQIKDAPPGQTSSVGEGEGGTEGGGITTTTSLAPGAVTTLPAEVRQAPRTRKCVTEPGFAPRQTEDPQSPPCVPLWQGADNGGATSKGVTANEIVIAVPGGDPYSQNDQVLEAYFNKRYEFYGRRIRLVPTESPPGFTTGDKMQAAAVKIDEQVKAFASLSIGFQQGQEGVFYDALARRGIISSGASFAGPSSALEADYAKSAPYVWNYYAPLDLIEKNMAEVICKRLVGRPARFAGGSEALAPTRKFGMIIDATVKGAPPITGQPLLSLTQRCGAVWDVHRIEASPSTGGNTQAATKDAVTKMQGNGVTTVVCLCLFNYVTGSMENASIASPPYQPEWFVQHFGGQDVDYFPRWPLPHADHVIGVRSWNKAQARKDMPHWIAKGEMNPTMPESMQNFDNRYWELLLIASGIQLAGPNLTPQSFEQGLQRARFPNPNCGKAPSYQACVGFEGGTHTMIKNFAFVWWDTNGRSLEHDYTKDPNAYNRTKGNGAYCYEDLGTRHGLGTWPTTEPRVYGNNPCR